MALTGLAIYKQLPKTNCKDCGFPTCLAFAMKMAAKQVSLDKCPHVTDEAKAAKNRLHLDFRPDDQAREVDRLLALGASRVDIGQGSQSWVVLADPEGNEFCVLSSSTD